MCGLRFGALEVFLVGWFSCTLLLVGAQITDPTEVDALQSIKEKLTDPQKFLRNWNKGDPCTRNWTGVICSDGILSDGYLHVKELLLLNMNLSGTLAPELGQLSYMKILDFMWNKISGNVPKEIGNIKSLELLLLSGNQLAGSLPDELGYLPHLNRIQIDENHISGSLPKSFANLTSMEHIHLNNNSIRGQIPAEFSRLPHVIHILLDNNQLSGHLPPEFSQLPKLHILQLDNNKFDGSEIPTSYSNISSLLKLSLRNCNLVGRLPDLSQIPELGYLDLSGNQLSGHIPSNKLSANITTIDLSSNNFTGPIPINFSGLPLLQRLSLQNNKLSGSVPSAIWHDATISGVDTLTLDFQNNLLSNISSPPNPPANVTVMLHGNPICTSLNQFSTSQFCGRQQEVNLPGSTNTIAGCPLQGCPIEENFDYAQDPPVQCFCSAPIRIGYRLKSPGISVFPPYEVPFRAFLSRSLGFDLYQLKIDSYAWEEGPRLRMQLKLFPQVNISGTTSRLFNDSEVQRIRKLFSGWRLHGNHVFGPYELLNFTLLPPYRTVPSEHEKLELRGGAVAGIVLGSIVGSIIVSSIITIVVMRKHRKNHHSTSRKLLLSNSSIKVDGVRSFTFGELALATNRFSNSTQIGQGGYGKVYKGFLRDGTAVAIKRAQVGSLQGEKEFLTEIRLLSRVHHRNLVSLLGYCDERGEQMLVYEFMPNGTLRDQLSAKVNKPPNFPMRLQIAHGSAKGILYLHTEANPPIFHRDIKASNILLDSKFTAKVADFGLSRLAPIADAEGAVPGHVSTIVKGTPGYLDPEYFLTHKLTDKSDVYSLGIVFLELLTGMQPISHGKNIVREVSTAFQSGMMFSIIDSRMGSYPSECIERFLTLALRCCRDEPDGRPSVAEIVQELESIWCIMPECDITLFQSMTTVSSEVSGSSPSTSMTPNSMVSEVSRNDLVSSVVPVIRPR